MLQKSSRLGWTSLLLFIGLSNINTAAEPRAVFPIWPSGDSAPGETRIDGDEQIVEGRRRPFYQLTNISTPTISFFPPASEKRTGAAILVCPGGGLRRLAYEHEGLEIADWLNPLGITVFVLKYRVPAPAQTGLMDAQRAMGLIRQRAAEFKIDPERISVMGFSAGGEIGALLATNHAKRAYQAVDDADSISCKPTNVCLVYPGGIVRRRSGLRDEIASGLDPASTPSMFIVHAFHDASYNSLGLASALKSAGVPCELHIYQQGGHGFGARDTGLPLNSWKTRYLEWLKGFGFFDMPLVGTYANQFAQALRGDGDLPRLTDEFATATVAHSFSIQKRLVRGWLPQRTIAGFKGGATNTAAQQSMGIDHPMTAVLFSAGRIDEDGLTVLEKRRGHDFAVETELGFIISDGVDVSYRLTSIEHTKGAIGSVVPVIELPDDYSGRMREALTAADAIASNMGSARYIVGRQRISPDDIDPDDVQIELIRDGNVLHRTRGGIVKDGQWGNLMTLINQMVDQGYSLSSGDIIICGALGQVHPAQTGKYQADFGPLGSIAFEIR